MLIAFHKPCGVLSQFRPDGSTHRTLAAFGLPPRVYPMGRLDADSEGLLLLSDEPGLSAELLDPEHGHPRTYWVQVDRLPSPENLRRLETGVDLQGYVTRPCRAWIPDPPPSPPPRDPPVYSGQQAHLPEHWISLELHEGKNRQVRRMTAAIQHPTLRLIRIQIGAFTLGDLPVGRWRELSADERAKVVGSGKLSAALRSATKVPKPAD